MGEPDSRGSRPPPQRPSASALTVVNVKVLLACAAAGLAIGAAHVGTLGTGVAVVYFTAIAGSTAAVPILAYVVWTPPGRPSARTVQDLAAATPERVITARCWY